MLADELPSSPPQGASPEVTIAYYKKQYEQLESELADFQASSQELEAELEKDVEAAEKRERLLQEKVESLGFEVEEWKVCCTGQSCAGVKLSFNLWLTLVADQVQTIQERGQCCSKSATEGDYHTSRDKQVFATDPP